MDHCRIKLEKSRQSRALEEQYYKKVKYVLQEKELLRLTASISKVIPQFEELIQATKERRPNIIDSHEQEELNSTLVLNLLKYSLYMQEHEMKLTSHLQQLVHKEKVIIPQLSDTEVNSALKKVLHQWLMEMENEHNSSSNNEMEQKVQLKQPEIKSKPENQDVTITSVVSPLENQLHTSSSPIKQSTQPVDYNNTNSISSNYSHRIGAYPVNRPQESSPQRKTQSGTSQLNSPNHLHSSHSTDKKKACIIN